MTPALELAPPQPTIGDGYADWLAERVDVEKLSAEAHELETQADELRHKAFALRHIIEAVRELTTLDEAA